MTGHGTACRQPDGASASSNIADTNGDGVLAIEEVQTYVNRSR